MTNLLQGGYIFDREDETETLRLILKHALANYENGWDNWVECLDDYNRVEVLSEICKEQADGTVTMAKCYPLAMLRAAQWVADAAEADSIKAENYALYDTGTQSGDRRYSEYVSLAERTKDAVKFYKEELVAWQKNVDRKNAELMEKHYDDALRDYGDGQIEAYLDDE